MNTFTIIILRTCNCLLYTTTLSLPPYIIFVPIIIAVLLITFILIIFLNSKLYYNPSALSSDTLSDQPVLEPRQKQEFQMTGKRHTWYSDIKIEEKCEIQEVGKGGKGKGGAKKKKIKPVQFSKVRAVKPKLITKANKIQWNGCV